MKATKTYQRWTNWMPLSQIENDELSIDELSSKIKASNSLLLQRQIAKNR